jgi:hypothetical protein
MISDPQTAGPRPPFSAQQQTSSGFTAKMDPNPDHGEHSYRGNGCRTAFSPSSRMPRAAPRSRPPNTPTWRLPPSAVTICRPCAAGGKDATSRFASDSISIPSRTKPGGSARGASVTERRWSARPQRRGNRANQTPRDGHGAGAGRAPFPRAIEGRDRDGPSRRSDRQGGPSEPPNDHRRAPELAPPPEAYDRGARR